MRSSSSWSGRTGTTHRWLEIFSSRLFRRDKGKPGGILGTGLGSVGGAATNGGWASGARTGVCCAWNRSNQPIVNRATGVVGFFTFLVNYPWVPKRMNRFFNFSVYSNFYFHVYKVNGSTMVVPKSVQSFGKRFSPTYLLLRTSLLVLRTTSLPEQVVPVCTSVSIAEMAIPHQKMKRFERFLP